MTHTTAPPGVPAALLTDVRGVLAAALERLAQAGWRRHAPKRDRNDLGARLVDVLNYASAHACVDRETHRLVITCAAMAIEVHTGMPAHELLPDQLADAYLSDQTSDDRLHQLDASIIVRYNSDRCTGIDDARALLRTAYDNAAEIIAAQLAHAGGVR